MYLFANFVIFSLLLFVAHIIIFGRIPADSHLAQVFWFALVSATMFEVVRQIRGTFK